jgi:hypothetical protein
MNSDGFELHRLLLRKLKTFRDIIAGSGDLGSPGGEDLEEKGARVGAANSKLKGKKFGGLSI